jgi:hypothetical protein
MRIDHQEVFVRSSFAAFLVAAAIGSITVVAQSRQSAPPASPQAAAQNLTVTVRYTGKGVVDATKNVVVALLDSPTVSPQSRPMAMQSVEKNGAVATFQNVSAPTVYVVAVYDEQGTWDHTQGPPPAGTPMGWYMAPKAATPTAVKVGPKTAVTLTFDGSKKFGQ